MGFVFRIYIGSVSEYMKILNQHTIFSKVYLYIDKYLEGAINPNPKVGYNDRSFKYYKPYPLQIFMVQN